MTTLGATIGDQSAGCSMGNSSGSKGKGQAPSPGQALQFCHAVSRIGSSAAFGICTIVRVFGIAAQEFLREIGQVVVVKLLCRVGRPPIRKCAHCPHSNYG